MNKQEGLVDQDTLVSSFKLLTVRSAHLEGLLWGPGRLGSTTPTRQAWTARRPEGLGAQIGELLADGAALRFYSLNESDSAIHRREQYAGRLTGRVCTRFKGGAPIQGAEVKDVTGVNVGRGRTLPLLTLMEFGNPPTQDYVVSLSDMAEYIQKQQVELTLD